MLHEWELFPFATRQNYQSCVFLCICVYFHVDEKSNQEFVLFTAQISRDRMCVKLKE